VGGDDSLPPIEAVEERWPNMWKGARMAVGTLRRFVLDVNDLPAGERFWAAVTGLEARFSAWQGQFSALGEIKTGSILLQLVPEGKTALKNRAHLDVTVEDLDRAVQEVIALGGTVVKPPGPFPEVDPVLEWAVMADPFGNEFCLIRDLEPNE
jgi:predicted enzyme related to lactoylglutathione lyase